MSPEPASSGVRRALDALALGAFELSDLRPLSDLSRDDKRIFEAAWLTLPEPTRTEAIRKINQLAERSFEFLPQRALDSAIRRDPSAAVRQLAILGSGEREDCDYAQLLLRLIAEDASIDVRAAAATGLATFCDMAAADHDDGILSLAPEIRARLEGVIGNPDEHPRVRGGALESIAYFGSNPFLADAIRDAGESGDNDLRGSALIAMGRTSDRNWLGELLEGLRSEDVDIRRTAAVACGQLGEADALVSLGTIARDHDADVRRAAIRAIGQIGGKSASTILTRLRAGAGGEESDWIDDALGDSEFADLVEPGVDDDIGVWS